MAQHTLDLTAFRAAFPAFADPVRFPDLSIQMWWTMATQYITEYDNCLICGDKLQLALNLMTAHLAATFAKLGDGSAASGGVGGPITSASEGSVSVSMQAPPSKSGWQYWLSTTPYGLQLWAFLSTLLVGGITVGGHPEIDGFRRGYGVFW